MKILTVLLIALVFFAANIAAQTSAFTYQGRLTDTTVPQPTSGIYNMRFALFDTAGTQIGTAVANPAVQVTNGIFTIPLDFGAGGFAGADRFLELSIFNTATGAFVLLTPRQPVTSSPYAIRSSSTASADGLTAACNPCVTNGHIVSIDGSKITGTVNSSTGFTGNLLGDVSGTQGATVVNTVGGQTAVSLGNAAVTVNDATSLNTPNTLVRRDAGGSFTANTVNAATQYNIGGFRVLSVAGTENLIAGINAGTTNTGEGNLFLGAKAGQTNTIGGLNSFVGRSAGRSNTEGSRNSFVGVDAGFVNTTGDSNSFFGSGAGGANTTSDDNTFVGAGAGSRNTTGDSNSFVGKLAGFQNDTGFENVFFGVNAGLSNTTGFNNTLIGSQANVGSGALTFATALGSGASVITSNTVILGRTADTVRVPGNFIVTGTFTGSGSGITSLNAANITAGTLSNARLGIIPIANGGTGSATQNFVDLTNVQSIAGNKFFSNTLSGNVVSAFTQYNINGQRVLSNSGTINLFVGVNAGADNTSGAGNLFVGASAGLGNTTGDANSFAGSGAGRFNTTGSSNSFVGFQAGENNRTGSNNTIIGDRAEVGADNLTFATAIGSDAVVSSSNTLVLGRSADTVVIPGKMRVDILGAAGSTSLCRNTLEQISTCTTGNLTEKSGDENFAAVNALREQNTMMLEQLRNQQAVIGELKQILCSIKPDAAICRGEQK